MIVKIIDELERDNVIRDICTNMRVLQNDIDDLIQEVYVILLEYNRDKIIELYKKKQLKFFIIGILQRQYHSNTSPFYKKYKKYYTLVDGNNVNKSEVNDDDVDDVE
jgi:hypothetical protein